MLFGFSRPSWTILLLLPLLTQCATSEKFKETIAFDSEPRGQAVYHKEKDSPPQPLGITPFFAAVPPHYEQFYLVGPDEKQAQEFRQSCGLRWSSSVVPGLIFLAALPPFGAAFLAVEYYTDHIFTCDPEMHFTLSPSFKPLQAECHRYLVIPPFHHNHEISRKLAKKWIKASKKVLNGCDAFIFTDDSIEWLYSYNIRSSSQHEWDDLPRKRWLEIAEKTDANHLVFLAYDMGSSDTITYRARIYDVFRDEKKQVLLATPLTLPHVDAEDLKPASWWKSRIKWFPNSIRYYYSLIPNFTGLSTNPNVAVNNRRNHQTLPDYLRNIAVDYINHPRGYDIWDASWDVSPSLKIFGESFTEKVYHPSTPYPDWPTVFAGKGDEYHLEYFYMYPAMNLGGTIFTPFVDISLALGWGPALLRAQDSLGINTTKSVAMRQMVFTLRNFSGYGNFYYQLDVANLDVKGTTFNSQIHGKSESYTMATFGVGYYFTHLFRYE